MRPGTQRKACRPEEAPATAGPARVPVREGVRTTRSGLAACGPRCAWVVAVLAAGCSLTSYSDIDVPRCQQDADCDPLSRLRGFPPGCRRFVCDPEDQQCEESPDERCDGADNDCDAIIDEGALPGREGRPPPERRVDFPADATGLRYAASNRGHLIATWIEPGTPGSTRGARLARLGEATTTALPMSYQTNATAELGAAALTPATPDPGRSQCRRFLDSGPAEIVACGFAELALAGGPERTWAASIDPTGCAAGTLRVGLLSRDTPASVVVRGPARRSSSFAGVDVTATGACTGGVRPACESATAAWRQASEQPERVGTRCGEAGECDPRTECAPGFCRDPDAPCTDDEDCPAGARCGPRFCQGSGAPCGAAADCPDTGELCQRFCRLRDVSCDRDEACGGLRCERLCEETPASRSARETAREAAERAIRHRCGLSAIAIAAVSGTRAPQALVSWVGSAFVPDRDASVPRPRCDAPAAPVEAMVAFRQVERAAEPIAWVTGSGEEPRDVRGTTRSLATPHTLGQTTGRGHPALAAVAGEGTFVAYGAADGGIALHFVPVQPAPPDVTELPDACCDLDCMADERPRCARYRDDVRVPPLRRIIDYAPQVPERRPIDHVALALGARRDDGTLPLGMAWREGCEADERIGFRALYLDLTGSMPTIVREGEAVTLASAPVTLGPPTVAYVDHGFVVPGRFRRAGATAREGSDGGWLVAWTRPDDGGGGSLMAARVSALDGAPLDGAPVDGASLGAEPAPYVVGTVPARPATPPRVHRDADGTWRAFYPNGATEALSAWPALCSPAPER